MFNIGTFDSKKRFNEDSLTKHAAILGATGSGKTVLCKGIIEEAVLNGIPVLAIDPKGDISSLGVCSKNLSFRPFSDIEAKNEKISPSAFEKQLKEKYITNLKNSKVKKTSVDKYCESINLKVYTPKSNAGLTLSIAPNLKVPYNFSQMHKDDPTITSKLVEPIAESLLSLVDYPLSAKKEIALVTKIIEDYWLADKSVEMIQLVHSINEPHFANIGALSIDMFMSKKQRQLLASKVNLLISTPSLKYWFEGEEIDFTKMFSSKSKTNVNVIDLRFIAEEKEKQFFVERLLQELYRWLLKQHGAQSLRYLLYMDEIKSFIPSFPANPPSKKMLELIVRQGRAFGLGCIFATQNPGDIDYKILGNINTRFIGKLRTEQDIEKVASGIDISAKDLTKKISNLRSLEFLYNEQDSKDLIDFTPRWLMSYHRGPLSEDEIKILREIGPGKHSTTTKRIIEKEEEKISSDSSVFAIPLKRTPDELVNSIRRDSNVKITIEEVTTSYRPVLHTTATIDDEKLGIKNTMSIDSNLVKRIHRPVESDINDEEITNMTLKKKEKEDIILDRDLAEEQATIAIRRLMRGIYFVSKLVPFYHTSRSKVILRNKKEADNFAKEKISEINNKYNPDILKLSDKVKESTKNLTEGQYKYDVAKDKGNKVSAIKEKIKSLQKIVDDSKDKLNQIKKNRKDEVDAIIKKSKEMVDSYTKVEFDSSDPIVHSRLIWLPSQQIKVKLNTKNSEFFTTIVHNWKGIQTLGLCSKTKKNLDNFDNMRICSYCAKTFDVKSVFVDKISRKSYCFEHFRKCEICGKSFGIDTLKECPNCSRKMCPEHSVQCPQCGNIVCSKCIITKGFIKKTPVQCKLCKE
ncbi:DUF853 family protein [Candidatus Woesearchaeota archaeon]|nr:DUF853 family protein [Candidatus Woesearchaeota archaeon]